VTERTEDEVLERIERMRRRRPRVTDERITLSHGSGGRATHTLIDALFLEAFRNPLLEPLEDQAVFSVGAERLAFTTDTYVVSPLFFPGGDIGDLAVNGTVNDLAVSGARPLYLSAGFVLEEGFPIADLRRIVASMAAAAEHAGVLIVTGDTKVVQRGKADGCFVNTAGIGVLERPVRLSAVAARPGDTVIVSGPVGDHGITIMLARGELGISSDLRSDTAPLTELVGLLLDAAPQTRFIRDATRGGVATICNELALASGVAVVLDEQSIPVRPEVRGASEILGIDPLYVACEGRFVAVVAGDEAEAAVGALHSHPQGEAAAVIGRIAADPPGMVLVKTGFGGMRIIDMLVGDPLPRIC
jgi:hydrogenase expression/formation protein HypE